MFSNKNYYHLAQKIKEQESVTEDNDMVLFNQNRYRFSKREVIPTDETYHDYYYHYLGLERRITLHSEFVDKLEFEGEFRKRKLRKKRMTFGISSNENGSRGSLNQPIFNQEFLAQISKKGYLTLYSSRK